MSKRRRIIASLSIGFVGLVTLGAIGMGSDPSASLRGRFAAMRDSQRGEYRLLVFGLPTPWRWRGAEIVHARHPEARVVTVAGCVVTPRLIDFTQGYNVYMKKAASRHFGHDIFEEAFRDAQEEDRSHPRPQP